METYDPLIAPNPEEWLSLDEQERLILITDHHRNADVELPEEQLHAISHNIVENQAAMGDETPAQAALERLVSEGLDRHDAVHAVGSLLANLMQTLLSGSGDTAAANQKYFDDLEQLTAAQWLKG